MSKLFYETIIDLIDTQVGHTMLLIQVKRPGRILCDDTQANKKPQKVVDLLKPIIEKCTEREDELEITNYLQGVLLKFKKGVDNENSTQA